MIKRMLCAVCAGLLSLLCIIQFDPQLHELIQKHTTMYINQNYYCFVEGSVESLSLLSPTISFKNVSVCSPTADWEWHCERLTLRFSWLDFLKTWTVPLDCVIDRLSVTSQMKEHYPVIVTYMEQFFTNTVSPYIMLKSLNIYKGLIQCFTSDYSIACELSSQSKTIKDSFKTNIIMKDGHIIWHEKKLLQQICGLITIDVREITRMPECTIATDIRTYLTSLTESKDAYTGHCFVTGRWEDQHGRFQVHNNDRTLMINPIIVSYTNGQYQAQLQGTIPMQWIGKIVDKPLLEGSAHVDIQTTMNDLSTIKGYVVVEDLHYGNLPGTYVLKTAFEKKLSLWIGDLFIRGNEIGQCGGSWEWDQQQNNGRLFLNNQDSISVPYCSLTIAPHKIHCSINALNTQEFVGDYNCQLTALAKDPVVLQGTFEINNTMYMTEGMCQQDSFTMCGDFSLPFFLINAEYFNANGSPLITVLKHDVHWYSASVHLSILRNIVSAFLQYELQEEGVLHAAIYTGNKEVFGKIYLSEDSSVRLPETYNFIKDFSCWWRWDFVKKLLRVYQLHAALHTGSIVSKEIMIHLPTCSYYMPLILQHCLFNSLHDLFAIVSGAVILKKEQNATPCIKADLMIERAQLKENIFSPYWQKKCTELMHLSEKSNSPDINYQFTCQTKDPIRIDTPFLQTDAYVDVQAVKSGKGATAQGRIRLPTGLLRFPYKPLYINHCLLSFNSDTQSPVIDLVASNRIRNYDIRLNVSGSLQDHCVLLSANPPLTQEQILGLLLVGSSQDSFNTLIPAFLMNNLRNVLFGSMHTDIVNQFFTSHIKPFSINLIPSFTDQTGRGGLRGAIEITVNDRLRALIQKNFSLTEDTRFELEYAVTDDIIIRAIRDERSDIGAEIEMRWKF